MQAAVYDFSKPAGQEIQFVGDHPIPVADPKSPNILVRTLAAGINPADYKLPNYPLARFLLNKTVVGWDICAEVLEEKAGFHKGDIVYGFAAAGSLAEYATVKPTSVVRNRRGCRCPRPPPWELRMSPPFWRARR
eukprot:GGOE01056963.1.p3 GENE.GGOE01056963.1~~GGOE01056963.1.p3  ORF type:complete len:135 (-),score=26.80 GGOE01056963.1:795-1199(-)